MIFITHGVVINYFNSDAKLFFCEISQVTIISTLGRNLSNGFSRSQSYHDRIDANRKFLLS